MPRRLAAALGAVLLAGCAVGPAFRPAPPVAPGTRIAAAASDSLRTFFDSLEARRETPVAAGVPAPLTLAADSAGTVAWLELLQDPALVELVREAVGANRDLQAAQARIREYRAEVGAARSALFPQLSANASAANQQVVFGSLGTFAFDAWRATADLSWELDFWGRIRRNTQAARAEFAGRAEDARATLLTLVADVARGYLELRELDANLAIAHRTLASRQATLDLARKRFEQGLISELDVRQFEAEVAVPAARVAEFTRAVAQKEHELSLLVGRGPGRIARGRPLGEVARGVNVPDSVTATLVARRPDVLRAERDFEAATARIGAATAARLPAFFVTGQYGTQSEEPGDMFRTSTEIYTIQGGVSLPLFTGGRLRSQEQAARARAEQARAGYEQTVLTALREVSDALVGVRTSRDQLTAQELQATALRRAYELAEKRYRSGIASYLEVLDAQRGLFSAELGQTQAERQYLASAVQLFRALGGSWE